MGSPVSRIAYGRHFGICELLQVKLAIAHLDIPEQAKLPTEPFALRMAAFWGGLYLPGPPKLDEF